MSRAMIRIFEENVLFHKNAVMQVLNNRSRCLVAMVNMTLMINLCRLLINLYLC